MYGYSTGRENHAWLAKTLVWPGRSRSAEFLGEAAFRRECLAFTCICIHTPRKLLS